MGVYKQNKPGPLLVAFRLAVACSAIVWPVCSAYGQGPETFSEPVTVAKDPVHSIYFSDSRNGFMSATVHDQHLLLRTTSSGTIWTRIEPAKDFYRFHFITPGVGWALSANGDSSAFSIYLMATRDGGLTWKQLARVGGSIPRGQADVSSLAFADERHGWVGGNQGGGRGFLLQTTDGGATFSPAQGLSEDPGGIRDILASRRGTVWILGARGVYYSRNFGLSWEKQPVAQVIAGLSLNAGWMEDNGHGVAVGSSSGGIILSTANLGGTWETVVNEDLARFFNSVHFWNNAGGCAVGGSTLLYCTTDGGATWKSRNVLPRAHAGTHFLDNVFQKIVFVSDKRGWVLAEGGFLFQTDDGGNVWKEVDPATLAR